jgi:hypothetical protein
MFFRGILLNSQKKLAIHLLGVFALCPARSQFYALANSAREFKLHITFDPAPSRDAQEHLELATQSCPRTFKLPHHVQHVENVKHLKALIGAGGSDAQREALCIFDPCPARSTRPLTAAANALMPGNKRFFLFATVDELELREGPRPRGRYGTTRGEQLADNASVTADEYHLVVKRPSWEETFPGWLALQNPAYLTNETGRVVQWKEGHEMKMKKQIEDVYVKLQKKKGKVADGVITVGVSLNGEKDSYVLQRRKSGTAKEAKLTVADLKREIAWRTWLTQDSIALYFADKDGVQYDTKGREGEKMSRPRKNWERLKDGKRYVMIVRNDESDRVSPTRDASDRCNKLQLLMLELYNGPRVLRHEPVYKFFGDGFRMRKDCEAADQCVEDSVLVQQLFPGEPSTRKRYGSTRGNRALQRRTNRQGRTRLHPRRTY